MTPRIAMRLHSVRLTAIVLALFCSVPQSGALSITIGHDSDSKQSRRELDREQRRDRQREKDRRRDRDGLRHINPFQNNNRNRQSPPPAPHRR